MLEKIASILFFALATASLATASGAIAGSIEEPTVHDIYEASHSGHPDIARRMISVVLKDHPDSGRAHYVNAELLAKSGLTRDAGAELRKAELLSPGLPFASPDAVRELVAEAAKPPFTPSMTTPSIASGITHVSGLWIAFLIVAALTVIMLAITWRRGGGIASSGGGLSNGGAGAAAQYPASQPAASGGFGGGVGGVVSSLATGLGIGIGAAAGEELVHHLIDGSGNNNSDAGMASSSGEPLSSDNMGGNDFGVADSSSWDDDTGGGVSGGDWSS